MAVASIKVYLTTLLIKVFSFSDFLGVRDEDVTETGTDIWTDRLFSENIILDMKDMKCEYLKS